MAIRDLFRRTQPGLPAPQTEAKGGTGRQHSGGFLDYDEKVWKLRGHGWYDAADKMWRSDGDARRALMIALVPIIAGTWTVEPPGNEDDPATEKELEATALAEYALFDPEGMNPQLAGHLWQVGRGAGRWGSAPFEIVWKPGEWNGRQVWLIDTLDIRRPRAIEEWLQDGHRLTGIAQWNPGKGEAKSGRVEIPISDLVYYRFGEEGDNWEGESLLRPAYKHYFIKDKLELLQAQALELLKGVPTGYAPESASAEHRDEFEDFLSRVGSDDAFYWLAPGPHAQYTKQQTDGWYWEFVQPDDAKGTIEGFKVALDHHSDKIAAAVLAEFMRQGMSKNGGTNASSETQQNPFLMFCEALAKTVFEAPLNSQLMPRLMGLNYSGIRMPKVTCSLIDSTTLTELADYVQKLTAAGALRPEPRLEEFLRDRGDLPPADEDAIAEREQQEAEQAQVDAEAQRAHELDLADRKSTPNDTAAAKPTPTRKATRTLSRADRDLKPHEQHMSLDRIEGALDGARDRLQLAVGPDARQLAADLAAKAAAGQPLTSSAPAGLAAAIERELQHLYDVGRLSVREELASQGHPDAMTLAANPVQKARALAARARAAADAIVSAIQVALRRKVLQTDDLAQLTMEAERAAASAVREESYAHASAVVNTGRSDQADDMSDVIAGSRYTSILDPNRCSHCRAADDDVLRPLSDPVRLHRKPPNPDCEGGHRCRCMEAFQLKAEAAAAV